MSHYAQLKKAFEKIIQVTNAEETVELASHYLCGEMIIG